MKTDIARLLQKKRNQILEFWMKKQLADAAMREDLVSNEELNAQSI